MKLTFWNKLWLISQNEKLLFSLTLHLCIIGATPNGMRQDEYINYYLLHLLTIRHTHTLITKCGLSSFKDDAEETSKE